MGLNYIQGFGIFHVEQKILKLKLRACTRRETFRQGEHENLSGRGSIGKNRRYYRELSFDFHYTKVHRMPGEARTRYVNAHTFDPDHFRAIKPEKARPSWLPIVWLAADSN